MTEGATSTTDEDTKEEVNLWTAGVGTSGIHNEDPIEEDVEPSEQRTATTSQGLQSLERKQSSSEKNKISEKEDVL